MNARDPQVLLMKLKSLPPERVAEVEDFGYFLHGRSADWQLTHAATKAAESTFAKAWDNPDDAAYDQA